MPQCFPRSPRTVKIPINFCRKNSPIKNLHWTHGMRFWQTYRKISAESSKTLCPNPKKFRNNSKNLFSKNNLSENIPWTLERSFDNPTRLLSPKILFFSQSLKNNWKFWRFYEKEKYFFKHVLWTQRKHF